MLALGGGTMTLLSACGEALTPSYGLPPGLGRDDAGSMQKHDGGHLDAARQVDTGADATARVDSAVRDSTAIPPEDADGYDEAGYEAAPVYGCPPFDDACGVPETFDATLDDASPPLDSGQPASDSAPSDAPRDGG